MRPAGRTLQQKDSFPIKESNARFVQLRRCRRWSSSESNASFRSCIMLASIVVVSNKIPKNVNVVDGPSTLDCFTGA